MKKMHKKGQTHAKTHKGRRKRASYKRWEWMADLMADLKAWMEVNLTMASGK